MFERYAAAYLAIGVAFWLAHLWMNRGESNPKEAFQIAPGMVLLWFVPASMLAAWIVIAAFDAMLRRRAP